jgi:thioredoxin 1
MTELQNENFESIISTSKKCIVDFHATWCGPCKAMSPILESVENELGENLIYKIDVDKNRELAEKYGIRSIPTFILFENGQEKERKVGAVQKSYLIESLT